MPRLWGKSGDGSLGGPPPDPAWTWKGTSVGDGPAAFGRIQDLINVDDGDSDAPGQGLQGRERQVVPTSGSTLYTATCRIK